MIQNTTNINYKSHSLIDKSPFSQKTQNNPQEKAMTNLLKPLKDRMIDIGMTKGPISLISSILELFYDHKRVILSKDEIFENIQQKLKSNKIVILDEPFISFLDETNFYIKINGILLDKCFEKITTKNNEFIQINERNVKEKLPDIIQDLVDQYTVKDGLSH